MVTRRPPLPGTLDTTRRPDASAAGCVTGRSSPDRTTWASLVMIAGLLAAGGLLSLYLFYLLGMWVQFNVLMR